MEKGTKKKCKALIQEITVTRDRICQRPGCIEPSACGHHIFPNKTRTAFVPEAVIGVCVQDHTGWAHNKPKEVKKLIIERLGEKEYYDLRRLSEELVLDPDYDEIYQGLLKVREGM